MIRIIKPSSIPEKLLTDGVTETEKLKQQYESGQRDFVSSDFKKSIYGHKTVKDALKKAQYDKCCYCEEKEEIGDVEHFRPKTESKQDTDEEAITPGYYWLAYEWDNLFFSCPTCNRSYKKSLFPLADSFKRATSHSQDISEETPLFIDPQQENPEDYIGFEGYGAIAIDDNQKGSTTIDKLGINKREALVESRRQWYQICKSLYQAIHVIKGLIEGHGIDAVTKDEGETFLIHAQQQLEEAQKDEAEFASMIRCAVKHEFRF